MKRLNEILDHSVYRTELAAIEEAEKGRIFCRHGIRHFLDVSRLLYILCLEKGLDINKEVVYAIGFLHDIGRARQYAEGVEHHKASVDIAAEILPACGFDENETALVLKAIGSHRSSDTADELCRLTYMADKRSRNCFLCAAAAECNWSAEKRNMRVEI